MNRKNDAYQIDNIEDDRESDDAKIKNLIAQESSSSARDLKRFLSDGSARFVTEKGDKSTNIINRADGKTYSYPPAQLETFFTKLENNRRDKGILHFLERQDDKESGIMIDFDRYQSSKESEYNDGMFQNLSCHIAQLLIDVLDVTDAMTDADDRFAVNMYYTRKPKPTPTTTADDVKLFRDGFHLLIPGVMISRRTKRYILDQLVVRNIPNIVFGKLECLEESHNKMLDENSAHVPVMFYGCSKPGKPAYRLACAHNVAIGVNGGFPCLTTLPHEQYENDAKYNLAYELSLSFNLIDAETDAFTPRFPRYAAEPKSDLVGVINANAEQHQHNLINEDELFDVRNDISILTLDDADARYLKTALDLLPREYSSEYGKWFKVIHAIANCGDRYKSLAVYFSMRCPEKYTESGFNEVWANAMEQTYEGEPLSRNSIYYWAKTSNPTLYREMFNTSYYRILREMVFEDWGKLEHGRVAKLLHHMLRDKFVTDEKTNDIRKRHYWYEFVTKEQEQKRGQVFKYREEQNPDVIHKYIQQHLPTIYKMVENDVKSELENAEGEQQQKYLRKTSAQLRDSRIKLFNQTYCECVVKSAQKFFRVRGFCDELDQDAEVLGVGNGVLMLGQTAKLIQGYHEHRVSCYTDTNYIPFDMENHYIKTTMDIISQIFPEEDVANYVMMFLSTGLDGRPAVPLMLMLDGGGANGKTTILEWARGCLGDYGYKAPMNLLTDKREKGSNANSAFIGMKGKRLAIYSEADDEEGEIFINGGRYKEMISPEIQTGRELHKQQENFKITATQAAAFNKRLSFRSNDHAIWRRTRYYKCKVKFCMNPDPNNPYEQKEDSRIAEEYPHDPHYKSAMLSILTHYNERLRSEYGGNLKNVPCRTIDIETEEYRNTQDPVNQFITHMIVVPSVSPTFGDGMDGGEWEYSMTDITAAYRKWYDELKGHQPVHIDPELFESSRLGKFLRHTIDKTQCITGVRIRDTSSEKLRAGETFLVNLTTEKRDQSGKVEDADNNTNTLRANVAQIRADKQADEYEVLERSIVGDAAGAALDDL